MSTSNAISISLSALRRMPDSRRQVLLAALDDLVYAAGPLTGMSVEQSVAMADQWQECTADQKFALLLALIPIARLALTGTAER